MSAKKKPPARPTFFQRIRGLFRRFPGGTQTVFFVLAFFALPAAGIYFGWQLLGNRVHNSPEHIVGPGQIEITPLPAWIHNTDIVGDVYRDLSREKRLSTLDDDLAQRVQVAFSRQPWVARAEVKVFTDRVKGDLVYRRPVCMVEVTGQPVPIPVDAEARILPKENFSPVERAKYPRLAKLDQGPTGGVGDRWGDSRVVGAAEIADALLPVWEKMKLKTIQPCSPEKNNQTASIASAKTPRLGEYQFAVLSQGGLTILWGPSPAVNLPGEPSRERKLHKLEQFYGEHGSLDYSERPPVLDLRIP